jgi:molybdate transport system regulatory protein
MPHRDSARNKPRRLPALAGKPYEVRGRIWLDGEEGTFLGHGRVVLMENIREHGSITKAAKSMGMSYRHAWRLIDSMNRQAPCPFVITSTGGKNGGGTVVTPEGERAIRLYWKLHGEFRKFLGKKTAMMTFGGKEKNG